MAKRNAIIIFADGSKQMAHNLDDSRFNWYENKKTSPKEVARFIDLGIVIPEIQEPESYEQAINWKSQLHSMITSINWDTSLIRNKRQYEHEWHHLANINQEIAHQMMKLKDYIKAINISRNNEMMAQNDKMYIQQLMNELYAMESELITVYELLENRDPVL